MKLVQSCLSSRWEPPPNLGERLEYLPQPNGRHTTFFHHCYRGFHSNNTPILFLNTSEAPMWGITRFKRDGIANLWGPRNYPTFLHYVFEVSVCSGEAVSTNMPANGKPSKEEFFSGSAFFSLAEGTELLSCRYIFCDHNKLLQCCETLLLTLPD